MIIAEHVAIALECALEPGAMPSVRFAGLRWLPHNAHRNADESDGLRQRCAPRSRRRERGLHTAPPSVATGTMTDEGREHAIDGGGRGVLRRPRANPRLGRGDRGAVELRAAREPAERGRGDARAQGVLRGRAGRPGRGPSGLRSVHGETGAARPPARGTDAGARGGGGEGGGSRRLSRRQRLLWRRRFCRWLYWEADTKLLDEKCADYRPHVFEGNLWLEAREREAKEDFSRGTVIRHLADNFGNGLSSFFPLRLCEGQIGSDDDGLHHPEAWPPTPTAHRIGNDDDGLRRCRPNLSSAARRYLEHLGLSVEDLFHHVPAVLHDPAYREANAGALRMEWPRIPLPGWPPGSAGVPPAGADRRPGPVVARHMARQAGRPRSRRTRRILRVPAPGRARQEAGRDRWRGCGGAQCAVKTGNRLVPYARPGSFRAGSFMLHTSHKERKR